jgi:hypothetical protein
MRFLFRETTSSWTPSLWAKEFFKKSQ